MWAAEVDSGNDTTTRRLGAPGKLTIDPATNAYWLRARPHRRPSTQMPGQGGLECACLGRIVASRNAKSRSTGFHCRL